MKKPVVGRLPAGSGPVARSSGAPDDRPYLTLMTDLTSSSGAPDDRPYLSLPHVKIRIGSSVLVWTFIRCSSEFGYRHFCARVDYRHVSDGDVCTMVDFYGSAPDFVWPPMYRLVTV